jgi:SagB-type dehydrogenase family enzyme
MEIEMKIKFMILFSFLMAYCLQLTAQDLKPITLLKPSLTNDKPFMQVIKERKSEREFSEKELSLQDLSNIMWCANGINRTESGKRTIPTAMNKQDIEVYAVMKEGVYYYNAEKHELIPVISGDLRKLTGNQPWIASAPLNLVVASDTSKFNMIKDRSMILPVSCIDAGHASQNVYLYCSAANLNVVTRTGFDKQKFEEAMKLKPQQVAILALTIGYPK